jgi:hypothetical protein
MKSLHQSLSNKTPVGVVALLVGVLQLGVSTSAHSETYVGLKGEGYACRDSASMSIWDASGNSPLLRRDLIKSDKCWKTVYGLRVEVLETIGKFVYVAHPSNGVSFYAYKSDVGKIDEKPTNTTVASEKIVEKSAVKSVIILNSSEYGVVLINKKPTVEITIDLGGGFEVSYTIPKEYIKSGFEKTAVDQRNGFLQVGGKCKKSLIALRDGDHGQLKVLSVNQSGKVVEFQASGRWSRCDSSRSTTLSLTPTSFKVEGLKFDELMREHTPKELSKTI